MKLSLFCRLISVFCSQMPKMLRDFKELGIQAIDGYYYKNKCNRNIKTFMPDIVFFINKPDIYAVVTIQ